ncbi:MAG: BamA/TamA family outer membrane protein [Pyramidobacter sp.]|nr:BamA/TamA family outer membrane protein [Pyramidobacter sp.]
MKGFVRFLFAAVLLSLSSAVCAAQDVSALRVEGNSQVVSEHILRSVKSRVGEPLNQQTVTEDLQAIYDLGFFSYVDAKVEADIDGLVLTYVVTENPMITEIRFQGNTLYKEEKLKSLLFTQPGMLFNRVFFRNDIQRLKERFQADGYVMNRVQDVQVDDGVVTVFIVEPRIDEIIIQGNRRTKSYVIERAFPLKHGDLFNSTLLRHSIARLRNMGFFEDVNVGFEPAENPDNLNLIVTVKEKKSASLIFSVSYGSSSGLGGGASYRESNLGGRARTFEVGFEEGDYRNYWITLADPYMDKKTFGWKIGVYKREEEELTYRYNDGNRLRYDAFKYDEDRRGAYIGVGRKFGKDEKYNWYVTVDWHKSDTKYYGPVRGQTYEQGKAEFDRIIGKDSLNTKVFTTTLEVTRANIDRYLSYPKGDKQTLAVEQAWDVLGGEWDYTKYWGEAICYVPIKGVEDYLDLGLSEDRPLILAARVKAGFSSGAIPLSERYSLGGANSLRGYESGDFKGHEMFLGNVELRIPIDENFSIVAFYDIGNAWNTESGAGFDFNDLLDCPGVGVRVKTPLGNIRVDVAKGDETQFHFGFGEMF